MTEIQKIISNNHIHYSLKDQPLKIFSGNANKKLAKDICSYLEIPLGEASVSKFSNGEIQVKIDESVRGMDVMIIQPLCYPVNDNIMELLIMIDAVTRASAKSITAVIPLYAYAKQEKKTSGREPISAKLVANILTKAGAEKVITLDLHAAAIQGFFDIPVDNLYAMPILIDYFIRKKMNNQNTVIVSPDAGGVARTREFALKMDAGLAIVFKRRPKPDETEVMEIVGDVADKNVILVDDMISTGKTLIHASNALILKGARSVYACATHALLSSKSVDALKNSPLIEIVVTDSVPLDENELSDKFKILTVSKLLGEAIRCNYYNLSVSKLFE